MNKDLCSTAIEALPESISKDFRDYEYRLQRSWLNILTEQRFFRETRDHLAKALDCYRMIFEEWKTFYSRVDDRLKKAYKDQATRAIEGMTPGEVTQRVVDLDSRYKALCLPAPTQDVTDQANRIILAFDIAREQVAELALAYTKSQSDLAAAKADSDKYGEYLRIVGQPRDLQVFLSANFPKSWAGLADGRPLVDIATTILGKLKEHQALN
jgi:hypothetical protein